jgi:hypothetical protein
MRTFHRWESKGLIAVLWRHPLRSRLSPDIFPDSGGSIQQRRHLFELDIENAQPRQRARYRTIAAACPS